MSELCKWLHEQLEQLPLISFPFRLELLPKNGIYFFYEAGEVWGHGGNKLRIVRVGTHKNGNFRNRIKEHYLLDETWMNFDKNKTYTSGILSKIVPFSQLSSPSIFFDTKKAFL